MSKPAQNTCTMHHYKLYVQLACLVLVLGERKWAEVDSAEAWEMEGIGLLN